MNEFISRCGLRFIGSVIVVISLYPEPARALINGRCVMSCNTPYQGDPSYNYYDDSPTPDEIQRRELPRHRIAENNRSQAVFEQTRTMEMLLTELKGEAFRLLLGDGTDAAYLNSSNWPEAREIYQRALVVAKEVDYLARESARLLGSPVAPRHYLFEEMIVHSLLAMADAAQTYQRGDFALAKSKISEAERFDIVAKDNEDRKQRYARLLQYIDQQQAEKRASEQRATEQREVELQQQDASDAEQRAAEWRATVQRAADQRAAEQFAEERRQAEQGAAKPPLAEPTCGEAASGPDCGE
jgi:hypothetical protein